MALKASDFAKIGLASDLLSIFGQDIEARERAAAEEINADIDRQQTKLVRTRSLLNSQRKRKSARLFASQQQASFAKAGVGFSGSALDLIEESSSNAELDILLSEFNAASEARGLESSALSREAKASSIKKSGRARAATSLLKTGASFGAKFGSKD